MAIGSGLGSSFGISVATSTYGAFVAPTKFFRARSYSVNRAPTRVQGEGITADGLLPLGAHYVETAEAASATVEMDVTTAGFGQVLQSITGGTSAITGATGAYAQTHTLANNYGQNFTVQVGAPTRSGTVVPQTLTGGKVVSAEFSCSVTEYLGVSVEIDGQAFSSTATYSSPSYDTSVPFHGKQAKLLLGTSGGETEVAGVKSVSVSISRAMDSEDFTMDGTGLKSEPVLNGLYEITGSVEVDWLAKSTFQDIVEDITAKSLIWEFEGAELTGTTVSTFRIALPNVTFEGDMQGVSGVDVLTNTWNFTMRTAGTLPTITYIAADASI